MKLSEQYAFTTPSPDEDKDIWVVPLEITAQLEAENEALREAMHKNKAIEQLEEADNMLAAGWSKMDSLEWKRWAFIMAVRLMSALVNAVLSIREEK